MHTQRLAVASKAGNVQATTDLTRQAFVDAGIPGNLADSFGFTDRIVQAEIDFQKGRRSAISEAIVVKAVNNLVSEIGAPAWARTSIQEVRKLRMHLLVTNPQLYASKEPADSRGIYKAVSEGMSPLEVSALATSLLFQKTANPEYQFTKVELEQNGAPGAAQAQAAQAARTAQLQDLLQGKTQALSIRDLLSASDRFFSDLGVEPVPGSQTVSVLHGSMREGGR